jgi:hypothetical protein
VLQPASTAAASTISVQSRHRLMVWGIQFFQSGNARF